MSEQENGEIPQEAIDRIREDSNGGISEQQAKVVVETVAEWAKMIVREKQEKLAGTGMMNMVTEDMIEGMSCDMVSGDSELLAEMIGHLDETMSKNGWYEAYDIDKEDD